MLYDGITLVEGSEIYNLTVATGALFPALPSAGEMMYLTSGSIGLYVYDGIQWNRVGDAADTSAHIGDMSVHLTSTENTFLDAISVSAVEINYLAGVSSAIQTQLNTKLNRSGDTMTGSLVMPTATKITLTDAPTVALDAANKAYVDTKLGLAGGSMSGDITMTASSKITLPNAPLLGTDATNKAYVDSLSGSSSYMGLKIEGGSLIKYSAQNFNIDDMDDSLTNATFTVSVDGKLELVY